MVAAGFAEVDVDDADLSEALAVDLSDEPDASPELFDDSVFTAPSPPSLLAEPLLELFAASRLSVR